MSSMNVTSEELDALAKRIIETDETAQGYLRQVRSAAETVGASWTGQAATAFQNLINRFDDDSRKVQEALRAIAEQIASSADVYARQEEENKSAVSDVVNRLG